MEIMEAIEALKNNNELCRDGSEGECLYCEDDKCYCAVALVVSALEEYIAIGTVEECREARERQRGKKPVYRSILQMAQDFLVVLYAFQGLMEVRFIVMVAVKNWIGLSCADWCGDYGGLIE